MQIELGFSNVPGALVFGGGACSTVWARQQQNDRHNVEIDVCGRFQYVSPVMDRTEEGFWFPRQSTCFSAAVVCVVVATTIDKRFRLQVCTFAQ